MTGADYDDEIAFRDTHAHAPRCQTELPSTIRKERDSNVDGGAGHETALHKNAATENQNSRRSDADVTEYRLTGRDYGERGVIMDRR